jgi:hypothetical protein
MPRRATGSPVRFTRRHERHSTRAVSSLTIGAGCAECRLSIPYRSWARFMIRCASRRSGRFIALMLFFASFRLATAPAGVLTSAAVALISPDISRLKVDKLGGMSRIIFQSRYAESRPSAIVSVRELGNPPLPRPPGLPNEERRCGSASSNIGQTVGTSGMQSLMYPIAAARRCLASNVGGSVPMERSGCSL